MLGLGIAINKFKAFVANVLSLTWVEANGDGTISADGLTLIKGPTSAANWYGHSNEQFELSSGITIEWTSDLQNITTTSAGARLSLSRDTGGNGNIDYGIFHYSTSTRYRIRENHVIVYNDFSASTNHKFKMLWTGSAMEYYEDDVLIYTGSFDIGAIVMQLQFLISPAAYDTSITISEASTIL